MVRVPDPATPTAGREPPPDAAPLGRAPLVTYGLVFAAGVAVGLVELVTDADEASTGAGVAVANLVHVVIALVVTAVLARAWRRDPAGLRRWLRTPFTQQGWRRLLDALVALPLGLAETVLLAVGRRRRVAAIEDRRRASLGAGPADPSRLGRLVVGGLPLAVVGMLAALVALQAVWRIGEQVFAALDPDFTRDAWGGPTYVGATLAHWMDSLLLFAGCSALVGLAARRRARGG